MPGPGQGKRGQKKKWCESAHPNANIAAVNTVMSTDTLTATMEAEINTATTKLPATSTLATTTAQMDTNEAADDRNDEVVNATTATSSGNDSAPPLLVTYNYEEIQQLLHDVRLE
jgi:hypothetical protein